MQRCRNTSSGRFWSAWRGPQDVSLQEGGREIHTTWGEMAWQLGGADTFDMIAMALTYGFRH